MPIHSAAFTAVRALEILVAIPIIGMLGWFVDNYRTSRQRVPDRLLAFFIISVLSAAWAIVTLHQFRKIRAVSGPFIAIIDILFMGAWIAAVVLYRGISKANCGHLTTPLGVTIGDKQYGGGSGFGYNVNKECAMTKASWAMAIAEIVFFFITAVLSWSMYRAYKNGTTVHSKDYTGRRSGSTSTYSSHRQRRHRGTYAV